MKLPADVHRLLARRFDSQHRNWLSDQEPELRWPLTIALGAPTEQAALQQVENVRAWTLAWRTWQGAGTVSWVQRQWRVLGTQRLPETITFRDAEEVSAVLGQQARWHQASLRYRQLVARWPSLALQLGRLFDVLADYPDGDFVRLLNLVQWLKEHPQSNLYPRQLPVAGIDSKWLEARKGVIAELLGRSSDSVLERDFHVLCGLRRPPVHIRVRILDARLRASVGGIGDLSAPIEELAQLDVKPRTVLVVENLQSALALDDFPGAIAFMALGYSVDVLGKIPWVADSRVLYWGDVDTHGFAILDLARRSHPRVDSVMMDEATLLNFAPLWGVEPAQEMYKDLDRLTADEFAVCQGLRQNRWGQQVRLEQERISWDYVQRTLSKHAHE